MLTTAAPGPAQGRDQDGQQQRCPARDSEEPEAHGAYSIRTSAADIARSPSRRLPPRPMEARLAPGQATRRDAWTLKSRTAEVLVQVGVYYVRDCQEPRGGLNGAVQGRKIGQHRGLDHTRRAAPQRNHPRDAR